MRILVTNDDGIYARGLWALAQELKQIGDVLVMAPDRDQTGAGTSVTLTQPVTMRKINPVIPGIETYAVEGTPADSVILALGVVAKDKVDLVISGINEGANVGYDVFISGTFGAALQGYFYRIPAIAVSVLVTKEARFDVAARLTALMAQRVCEKSLPEGLLLNLNFPDLPIEEIKGIEVTRLGQRSYRERIRKGRIGKSKRFYWVIRDRPPVGEEQGTDVWAVKNGLITVTSLHGDITNTSTPYLEEWCQSSFHGLGRGLP